VEVVTRDHDYLLQTLGQIIIASAAGNFAADQNERKPTLILGPCQLASLTALTVLNIP
jgi:hypothetical protein